MEIRYITVSDDRLAISKVYEESWKYAYKGIIPQDYLDSIPEGQWASHIEQAGRKNLVMLQDGIIIGTSGFSKSRMAEMNDFGEIISLYLLPEYMGKGYGKLLLQAAVSELKKMGFDKVFLWVLEENQNARHFYEKCGFVQTESCLYSNIGGKELKEVQYCYQDYMTEIHLMTEEDAYWKETISFAERCSWKAGSFLARKMQENEFKEWERVCVVCVNGNVAGFSTFTERDELSEQYGFTPFIGFIFVDE